MSGCIFCEIVAGRAPASIVWEDDATVVFMDIRQLTDAHLLVVPRSHVETIDELPLDIAARLMQATVFAARAMKATLEPAGISLWQSNGEAAGQEVPHVHIRLITREPGDKLVRIYPTSPRSPGRAELDSLAAHIAAGYSET